MALFIEKVKKNTFESNVVVRVGTQYFSQKPLDSGLSIPLEHIGLVLDASITPVRLDITKAKTSISSIKFELLDKDDLITNYIMTSTDSWIGRDVIIWVGTVNCSCSFTSYKQIAKSTIKSINKKSNSYEFQSNDPLESLNRPLYENFTRLSADIGTETGIITVQNADALGTSIPIVAIGNELCEASYISSTQINLSSRGAYGTDATEHKQGEEIYNVRIFSINSMNAIRFILEDLGVTNDDIISEMFDDLRDNQLSLDGIFTFYLWNIPNALNFIEQELLMPTNTRLIVIDGKIGITILDENVIFTDSFDESVIRGTPKYTLDGNRLVNLVNISYDYDIAEDKFLTTDTYKDEDSIDLFGERPLNLEWKGITTLHNGQAMTKRRADRYLGKLSFPLAQIEFTSHFKKIDIIPSQIVQISHRYLPRRATGMGMRDIMEITGVGIRNLKSDPEMQFKCEYNSFGILRLGLISPSPAPINITSQSVFEVPDGEAYEVGYKLVLWDSVNEEYYPDAVNTITGIIGNEITMENAWTTTLTSDVRLFFATYDECSNEQKNRYAFISPDTNLFSTDDRRAYSIIFS